MNVRGLHVIVEHANTWRLCPAIFRNGWFVPRGSRSRGTGVDSVEPIPLVDGDLVGAQRRGGWPRARGLDLWNRP